MAVAGRRKHIFVYGHSSCRSVFSISLSTAALHLRAGGLMFARTGSQGNDAEHKVPVIRHIMEFS